MPLAILLHVLGIVLWLGGGLASMVMAMASRRESGTVRAGTARLLAAVHARIISPGALLTLVTGFYITMRLGPAATDRGSVIGMAVFGLLAGIITLLIGLPTALKRARAAQLDAQGELPPIVAHLSKRQAVISTIAGLLGLAALAFAYLG